MATHSLKIIICCKPYWSNGYFTNESKEYARQESEKWAYRKKKPMWIRTQPNHKQNSAQQYALRPTSNESCCLLHARCLEIHISQKYMKAAVHGLTTKMETSPVNRDWYNVWSEGWVDYMFGHDNHENDNHADYNAANSENVKHCSLPCSWITLGSQLSVNHGPCTHRLGSWRSKWHYRMYGWFCTGYLGIDMGWEPDRGKQKRTKNSPAIPQLEKLPLYITCRSTQFVH